MIEKIKNELKNAMKIKDRVAINVYREMITKYDQAIKEDSNIKIEDILIKMVKIRNQAIEGFQKINKSDYIVKAENEKKEKSIIQSFLPKELSEEDIKSLAIKVILNIDKPTIKHMGMVMKHLKDKTNMINGKIASKIVRELLLQK